MSLASVAAPVPVYCNLPDEVEATPRSTAAFVPRAWLADAEALPLVKESVPVCTVVFPE